jgi:transglutaminase-like putative cysteine protease
VNRRHWVVAIFAAWALSLGWLVKREFFRTTGERLAEAALAVPPGTAFYRVELAGQQVGFASTTVDTVGTALLVADGLLLDLPVLGRLHHTRARSRAVVSRALRLETLDVTFDGDEGRFVARAEVSGDSVLAVTLSSDGQSHTTRTRLTQPIVVPSLVPLRLAFGGGFAPGHKTAIRVFDPFLLSLRDVTVRIAAESTLVVTDSAGFDSTAMMWTPAHFDTVRAFRIEQRSEGLTTSHWVDAQGHIVRSTNPVGLSFDRSAWEIAYRNFRTRDTARAARASARLGPGTVVATTALLAGAALKPTGQAELRAVLAGADLSKLQLAGGRQDLMGDTVIVRREGAAALAAAYQLPARDPGLGLWLAAQPLVEVNDPRIRTVAHEIVGDETDPARAGERIARWMTAHVRRAPVATVPSAVRVLTDRVGDCNEFTVLYVALARAAGLPARPTAGLVKLGDRFYYHAWPEVYLGSWVAVDPLLGQFPADAGHLRFVVDGLARQVQLVRFIGRMNVEGL